MPPANTPPPLPRPTLEAIILAGGASTRMGTDKALLPIGHQPMVRRVYEAAAAHCSHVRLVSPWPDRYAALLPPACQLCPEPPAAGRPPGPLVGFARGLAGCEADWVLLLACDLPRLRGADLAQGVAALPALPPEVMAYLPHREGRWEPLCGFYRRACASALDTFVAQGGRSFQRWLETLAVRPWPIPNPACLLNCNTPDDWARLAEGLSGHPEEESG